MASADYYLCDVCGSTTFYDADLHYEKNPDGSLTLIGVGHMACVCPQCADKGYRVAVQAPEPSVQGDAP